MSRNLAFYAFLLCSSIPRMAIGQVSDTDSNEQHINEAGLPYIQNYTPDDYNYHAENFNVVQDSLGILYFANADGVLMYDGVNWEIIELPGKNIVLSLAIDNQNRIYVGASEEFGYIESDGQGKMVYVSMIDLLKEQEHEIAYVRDVHVAKEGVYFRDRDFLIRWANNQLKIWDSDTVLLTSFLVGNDLYVCAKDRGLMRLENDELKLVAGGDFFKDKRIGVLLPHGKASMLVGTLEEFFIYENGIITPFKTELDAYIERSRLYSGIKLNDGSIALATLAEGVAVMESDGRKKILINKDKMLSSKVARRLFQDRSGILWVGFEYGISKIEFPSPFSKYELLGLSVPCYTINRFEGEIYAGTINGLFRLKQDETKGSIFEPVKDMENIGVYDLVIFDNMLIISGDGGLYQLKNNEVTQLKETSTNGLLRSNLDANRVFVTMSSGGIESIYFKEGRWVDEGLVNGAKSGYNKIVEEASGNLWLGSNTAMVCRISFENSDRAKKLEAPIVEEFGTEDGLPNDRGIPYLVNGTLFFASIEGKETFEFDRVIKKFKPDETLNSVVRMIDQSIYIEYVDKEENMLFSSMNYNSQEKHYAAWKSSDGGFKVQDLGEERIRKDMGWSWLVEAKDKIIWHGGEKGIVRYDLKTASKINSQFPALLKKVVYKNDSLLVQGPYFFNSSYLPFKNNNFRFEYAAPSFQEEKANTFQYFLEGFDEDWSTWTSETKKDYTNLPEASYTFKVRAKNIFGKLSTEDSYSFTILPPWYRTWWAYVFYSLLAVMLLWSFNRLRSQQLRAKNLSLESIISERTEEVRLKNELLGQQTEKLKEMDVLKTRLFANISHEFRTPLTLIKSPIEKLEENKKNKISTTDIKMIRRNTNRLLGLVNQLLDLSKLDGGKMQLNLEDGDVYKCIRAAASAFGSHATSRNIDFQIKVPSTRLWASFDRDKLEKIMYNLLSNAFKFTPNGSKVTIHVWHEEHSLHLEIGDKGYGIDKKNLPHIFDRFYQVDDSYTKENTGTGIGLALTKELVDLMGGTILVESEVATGTIFMVNLPMEEILTGQLDNIDYPKHTDYDELFETLEAENKITYTKLGTVLVIEDNNDMRYYIKELLAQDYEVLEAVNGKEGLLKATKRMPDLIITDLMMPQMDGTTLCKKLKTDISTSHIPIIMLTAKAGIENKLEGLETGADEYLIKPFNVKELQMRVKNLIRQRQELRKLFSNNGSLDPKDVTVTSLDDKFLTKVLHLLETKHSDPDFGVPQMQSELAMGKTQLHMKIKALTNQPPGELLRNFRLKRATQLLSKKSDSISQVAYSVGFNSLSYFTKCFKDYYGSSPTEYFNRKEV